MTTRKRKAVITEETTVTRRQIALTEETGTLVPDTQPVRYAPGWHAVPVLTGRELREQRHGQVEQSLRRIWAGALDAGSDDRETVRCAASILRAGPGASPLELLYGRVL